MQLHTLNTSDNESSGEQQEDALAILERAAKAERERPFVDAYRSISMDGRSEGEYERALRLALRTGALLVAEELAKGGSNLFPGNPLLEKYNRLLAPARVIGTSPAGPYKPRDNIAWLKANRSQYRGKWVGIRGGELLGVTDTLEELSEIVGREPGVLLTHVE